jgi:formate hydrogenlyase subunit 3/multisubunit Na+/H+ antiporter MnhD subunit
MNELIMATVVPVVSLITIGFVLYVYFTTRTKQRMLQIEKGVDSSLFKTDAPKGNNTLMFGLLFLSVGIGVFVGYILSGMGIQEGVAYNGSIFIMGGLGLLVYHRIRRKDSN